MKKAIAVLLCVVILLLLAGCQPAARQNAEARAVLSEVLEGKHDFAFKNMVYGNVTNETLEKFSFMTYYSIKEVFLPFAYMYVDFDGDGIDELLVVDGNIQHFLFLRYDSGSVTGYVLNSISVQDIKTDGTFLMSWMNTDDDYKMIGTRTAICRVKFNGLDCEAEQLAYEDALTDTYQVNGKSVSKSEAQAHFDEWKANTVKSEWTNLS